MIYSIIMLSCSHKTHKGPSTETKAHTDACFPLTASVPPENVQQELPLPAFPCLSLPFPAPTTQHHTLAGHSVLSTSCTLHLILHMMDLREKRAEKLLAHMGVPAIWQGAFKCHGSSLII